MGKREAQLRPYKKNKNQNSWLYFLQYYREVTCNNREDHGTMSTDFYGKPACQK